MLKSAGVCGFLVISRSPGFYGTYSQKVQNRFLYGGYHSGILVVFRGSEYMEGHGMRVGKGLESGGYLFHLPSEMFT